MAISLIPLLDNMVPYLKGIADRLTALKNNTMWSYFYNSPWPIVHIPLKDKTPNVSELDPSTLGIGTLNKYDHRDDIYTGSTNPGSTNNETTSKPVWYKNPNLYADLGVGITRALAGGNESTVGNLILEGSKLIPNPFLSKLGQIAGAGYNALVGYKENTGFTNSLRTQLKALDNFRSGASTNDTLNALVGRIKGPSWKKGDLGTQGFFSSYIDDLDANFLALREAGELNALNELYWNGLGIALDYNNNLRNYSLNAAYGGPLFSLGGLTWPISGADWTNGVDYIGAGGSHESNPHLGVPVSIADDGLPNLVEEGEVLFNNYVFSKRIKAPKDLVKKYGGGGSLKTFADLALKAGEESKERPNDPISRNGLLASMSDLAMRQEEIRLLQLLKERLAALGGLLTHINALGGHMYSGTDSTNKTLEMLNWLDTLPQYEWKPNESWNSFIRLNGATLDPNYIENLNDSVLEYPTKFLVSGYDKPFDSREAMMAAFPNTKFGYKGGFQTGSAKSDEDLGDLQIYHEFYPIIELPLASPSKEDEELTQLLREALEATLAEADRVILGRKLADWILAILTGLDELGITNTMYREPGLSIRNAAVLSADFQPFRYSPLGELLRYEPIINLTNLLNSIDAQNAAAARAAINLNPLSALAALTSVRAQGDASKATTLSSGLQTNRLDRANYALANNQLLKLWSDSALAADKANQESYDLSRVRLLAALQEAAKLDADAYKYAKDTRDTNKSSWLLNKYNFAREALLEKMRALVAAITGGYYTDTEGNMGFVGNLLGERQLEPKKNGRSATRKRNR